MMKMPREIYFQNLFCRLRTNRSGLNRQITPCNDPLFGPDHCPQTRERRD
jgi:hypothetical protein